MPWRYKLPRFLNMLQCFDLSTTKEDAQNKLVEFVKDADKTPTRCRRQQFRSFKAGLIRCSLNHSRNLTSSGLNIQRVWSLDSKASKKPLRLHQAQRRGRRSLKSTRTRSAPSILRYVNSYSFTFWVKKLGLRSANTNTMICYDFCWTQEIALSYSG